MKTIRAIALLYSFCLVLICTKISVKTPLSETIDEAVEFKLWEVVSFNTINNFYFKYNNLKDKEYTILLYLINPIFGYDIILEDPDGIKTEVETTYYERTPVYFINLEKKGIYYLKIESGNKFFNFDEKFSTIVPGDVIETIDFSKEIYYNNLAIEASDSYPPTMYKVKNLKEDKYVYFGYREYDGNPFKICVNENDDCVIDKKFYYFEKGKEYTIYVQFLNYGDPYYSYYYYYPYIIAPILSNTIETITTGIFKSTAPKIYNINLENNIKYINFGLYQFVLIAKSDQPISSDNLQIIETLDYYEYMNNEFEEYEELSNDNNYYVLIVIPLIFEAQGFESIITVADHLITKVGQGGGPITIPSGKSSLVSLPPDTYIRETKNLLEFYNILIAYSLDSNNMRYIYSSNLDTKYNYLIHNFALIPTFIDKSSKEQKLNIKVYYPRYTFFGFANAELFKSIYSLFKSYTNSQLNFDWETLLPLNARINSDVSLLYEFFNIYFDKFEDNINLYINKLYGETNLYECSDELDKNDLSILQNPINKCKNKKSIFNRLFTFKGTKTLSGYLTPNSYFDIYLEFNDDSNKIKISQALQGTINSASKYIKKDIEYIVDFTVDHMVKIEILDNIEVIISNDKNTVKLNSKNPVSAIQGSNYKVKANKDTMIYFYGKLFKYIKQKELFVNQKGKFATITPDKRIQYEIDSGFTGFNPINIDAIFENKLYYDDSLYVENIYEKMKNKLVENEKIFLYYIDEEEIDRYEYEEEYEKEYEPPKINVLYNDSLNNPNNDYTFTVIPKNSEQKSYIINNKFKDEIFYHVNFCGAPHNVSMTYKGKYNDEYSQTISFNEKGTSALIDIYKFGTKINFKSEKEFIFSYSFVDVTDDNVIDVESWTKEREEELQSNLKITQVSENNNILSITFKPNYKKSNTKYIIVIAPENDKNTVDSLSNPCYIAKLVNNREDGVKIENWIDPGLTDKITAEVDVSKFVIKNNNYIIGIISQELRFYKKLNFYSAFKFGSKSGTKTLIIVFSIIGAIVLIIAIVLVVLLLKKRTKDDNFTETKNGNENKLLSDM